MDKTISFYKMLKQTAFEIPSYPCRYYEGKTITYASFLSLVEKAASSLACVGLKEEDRITLVAPNTPEAVALFYAASKLGLSIHLLHPLTSQENILREFKDKNSKLLIVVSIFRNKYPLLISSSIPRMSLDPSASLCFIKRALFAWKERKELVAYKKDKERIPFSKSKRETKEVSYDTKKGRILLSSGGTTGESKSIVLSDYAFYSVIENGTEITDCTREEVRKKHRSRLACLPMFHGFGLTRGILTMLCFGGSIALLPSFRTKKVVHLLKKKKLNILIGVPAIYEALLKNKDFCGDKLKQIKICFIGGDFIAPSLLERFNKRLADAGSTGKLFEGYGLTETVTVLSVNTRKNNRTGSIGKPLSNVKVKILDSITHMEKKPGEKGERAVTGPVLRNGYFKQEKSPFYSIDGEDYVLTGDIGYKDEDGYLYFVSRRKRRLKKKGRNVYPLAVEKRVSSILGIKECAFLGETYKGRDYLCLFVSLEKGRDEKKRKTEINDILKKTFNSYELPDFILVQDAFAHTNVGKVDYLILSKRFHEFLIGRLGE